MFTEAQRARLLVELVDHARADPRVTAAAHVGSGARQATDQWSDIDLALRLHQDADPLTTARSWQAWLTTSHDVVDHLDIWSGAALFRVLLLAHSLQIDLSFWPADQFRSNGEPFTLIFGGVHDPVAADATEVRDVIGWAWLYALHARSSIARNRPWQALHMINNLRDRIVTLACLRLDAPPHQGRGVDQLPEVLLSRLAGSLVATPDLDLLDASFADLIELLAREVQAVDPDRAARLHPALTILAETAMPGHGAYLAPKSFRRVPGQH